MSQGRAHAPDEGDGARQRQRGRGAFFTPQPIANYLAQWAVRSGADRVLDPACGEGALLLATARRLDRLGTACRGLPLLHGIEMYLPSYERAKTLLREAGVAVRLDAADFFKSAPLGAYDAVVGNPPFVRYQALDKDARARALESARKQGVRLSGMSNVWASFLVKAASHVRNDGRLALVLPGQLLSASYAEEIRRFLLRRFSSVRLIVFRARIFPGVQENVLLMLAEGSGGCEHIEVHRAGRVEGLLSPDALDWYPYTPRSGEKWSHALLEDEVLATHRALAAEGFEGLGAWGRVYLGAVTGNNGFFALSRAAVLELGLGPEELLRISPPGAKHLRAPVFTARDWERLAADNACCYLFVPQKDSSASAKAYIAQGEEFGEDVGFKCRTRTPWWRVPLVRRPDMVLTCMDWEYPRLVGNQAGVHVLNSVYGVALHPERREAGMRLLPMAYLNSVTLLDAELVGRSLGGGAIKIVPREAERLYVPSLERVRTLEVALRTLAPRIEAHIRCGELHQAVHVVDSILFAQVPRRDVARIREARVMLYRHRRATTLAA